MRQTNHTVNSIRMPGVSFLATGLVAICIILAFGFLSSPTQVKSTLTQQTVAADSPSTVLTSPSVFPNIKIKNFGQMDERFYRGAQPKPNDYDALAALGIKTIIDLRDDPTDYEKARAEALGMRYVNIPMDDKSKPSDDKIAAFFAVSNDAANWPFFVHCVGGRHRTGLIGAVYRFNGYGWDFDQVYQEMKNYDYYSRWGHGAIKDYVQEYYSNMKALKAALPVSLTEVKAPESQPVTPAPAPKPEE